MTSMINLYMKQYLFGLLLIFAVPALAQPHLSKGSLPQEAVELDAGERSTIIQAPLVAEVGLTPSTEKWAVTVRSRKGRVHTSPEMAQLKEAKMAEKMASVLPEGSSAPAQSASTPSIRTNFEGNWSLSANPPDNTLAISNGGYIVSANNDGLEYYNQSGTLLFVEFWSDFITDSQLTSTIYDPIVIYDTEADRFVMVVLHGTKANTSKVLVLFSKTNNPLDGWFLYQLTGNPLNNNTWFDYPNVGVSGQEIYVTGNLYDNNDNFNQSVIYQIEKAQGYAGGSLNWQHWFNLSSQPFPAFTLVPTSHGQHGNIGPGMLFVSSRPGGENRIRIWEITDYMGNNPNINAYITNVTPYSPAGDALMPNTTLTLDNSDCRILQAFYLNNALHYVFHSDIGQGWNGIHYNRLNLTTLANTTATLGFQGSEDFSFPVVASYATQVSDPTVMIAFLRSSQSIFPSTSVVQCDANMQWSQPVEIKAGETHINFLQGNTQRWGDYSGMARKHNSNVPEVWSATCYGADITTTGGTITNTYKTWIAQIGSGPVSLKEQSAASKMEVYPNPVVDRVYVDFFTDSKEEVTIEVIDMASRPVKLLYRDTPKSGENRLSFGTDALPAGVYFVSVKTASRTLAYEKIIVKN